MHNDVHLAEGPQITRELVERMISEELEKIRVALGDSFDEADYAEAESLFRDHN